MKPIMTALTNQIEALRKEISKRKIIIEFFKGKDGWRWRMKRGKIIASSAGDGYTRRMDCLSELLSIMETAREDNYEIKILKP